MSSIPRKSTKIRRFEAFQSFPQSLPDVSSQRAMNGWYDEMRRVLQRINDELSDPLNNLKDTVDQALETIAGIQAAITTLQAAPVVAGEDCCDELRASINQLIIRIEALENADSPESLLEVQDEGVLIGSSNRLNFVGDGVTATLVAGVPTITIPGGADLSGSFDIEDGSASVPGTFIFEDGGA